jgi:hypothetical protein
MLLFNKRKVKYYVTNFLKLEKDLNSTSNYEII